MKEFIDLGLPSGNLWASENEEGYHDFEQAKEKFGAQLPKASALMELIEQCKWEWDSEKGGYNITGPNGSSIFFPALGSSLSADKVGFDGLYWSSAALNRGVAYYLRFFNDHVYVDHGNHYTGRSVRLFRESSKKTDDYTAALQRAKAALKAGWDRETIECIFPELKMDGDEKIRKTLLDYYTRDNYECVEWLNGITYGELVDWLEKQRATD